jgi:macrolide transport system ATP-binding/permease protein
MTDDTSRRSADVPPETVSATEGRAGAGVLIRVRNLRRVYHKGDIEVVALARVDLDVREGEFLVIMGPSGSGKSTLMHLLGCLDKPTDGSYSLDGIEVSKLDDAELSRIRNRKVGFVFQTFNLLSDSTAADNIALPLVYAGIGRRERYESSHVAAHAMGLTDRLEHTPTELSGGQVQRVAIARALASNPRLILADEPTGNLDTTTGGEIMAIFHRLHQQGSTVIMVTHDEKLARYADRIVYLRDGQIVGETQVTHREKPDEEHREILIVGPPEAKRGHRMGWWDLIRIGLREGLWAHKMRTSLTMLGVMFGVAAVIAIVSVAEGAKLELMRHIEAMGANTIRISARTLEGEVLQESRSKGNEGLTLADARSLADVLKPVVLHMAPMKKVNADIVVDAVKGSAEVWATTPEYPPIVNFHLGKGSFITEEEMTFARSVCVLGETAARELFANQDPIGRQVTIGRTTYDVIGVMARKPVSEEDFNKHIYVPLTAALLRVKRSADASEIDRVMLAIKEAGDVKSAAEVSTSILKRRHFGVSDVEVSIPEEKLELQQKTRSLMNYVLAVMAAIALLVGGIGIMNIMLATVTERIREIGIRRAVGATQMDILKQFLAEAVGISFVGGFIGIGLGFLLGYEITGFAGWAKAVFSFQATLVGFGVAVAVGLIFGIYPAWTAAKQDPIEALRYE